MAVISRGIELNYVDGEITKVLTNLQEIPELGGSAEAIEITTLADFAHTYTDGLMNYGDSLDFKFLYEKEQFNELQTIQHKSMLWSVNLPDGMTCEFNGTCSVKLDGVGVNAALTYTLSIKPNSPMAWEDNA